MRGLYVYSAVPPNSNRLLRKYGLLSGSEVVKLPEVLKAARPKAKDRRAFEKRVKEVLASERPYPMMGPSVLFTPPDPKKITDKHFIKKWNLQSIRIDLGRLLEDYPDTIVWGAELLPYDKAWRDMSEEEFEEEIAELGYASWEDFAAERSRELTLEEVRDFTQKRPEVIWEHYSKSDAGKMYASNVPHAFIITPIGYIPYEYIEYVDEAHTHKNPKFEYKSFAQKRERMVEALIVLEEDEDDGDALSVLQTAIDDNADTIEYLKYMTPFYKHIVESSFHEMSKVDWEVCEYTAERVLNDNSDDEDKLISWVFEKVRELYTYCGEVVINALSDLRTEYIRQNPKLNPALVFEFGRESLDRLEADAVNIWESEEGDSIGRRGFRALYVDIESEIGYLGVVYAFLNTANIEYSALWPHTDLDLYIQHDYSKDKDRTFNIYELFESVKNCVTGDDTEDHGGFVPMWMINTVHSMDFYCESMHLTHSKSGRYAKGSLEVTPETLQTKLSDYKSAAWATYGRDLPLVTQAVAPRGLVFSWSDHILCQGGFKKADNNIDSLFFAGENCIFLYSKSNVTLCRQTDFALETVSLLSAVEDTIPCIIKFVFPEHIAFIGQQGELPLLVIDESDNPPRPFVCYVLSELRKFMLSDRYQASDNLNSVPVLTHTQVDAYLAESKRPNPHREWFETQGRQNDGGVSRENLKRVIYEDGNQIIKGVSWIRGPYDSAAHVELETNIESIVNYIFEHMKDIAKNLDEEGNEDSEIYEIERHIFSEKPMYLEYIHVDAKERGKGLGSVLMTELEELLVQKGFDTVYLVAEPAERSAWYMRLGYSPIYPTDLEDFEEAGAVVMKKTISAS